MAINPLDKMTRGREANRRKNQKGPRDADRSKQAHASRDHVVSSAREANRRRHAEDNARRKAGVGEPTLEELAAWHGISIAEFQAKYRAAQKMAAVARVKEAKKRGWKMGTPPAPSADQRELGRATAKREEAENDVEAARALNDFLEDRGIPEGFEIVYDETADQGRRFSARRVGEEHVIPEGMQEVRRPWGLTQETIIIREAVNSDDPAPAA